MFQMVFWVFEPLTTTTKEKWIGELVDGLRAFLTEKKYGDGPMVDSATANATLAVGVELKKVIHPSMVMYTATAVAPVSPDVVFLSECVRTFDIPLPSTYIRTECSIM